MSAILIIIAMSVFVAFIFFVGAYILAAIDIITEAKDEIKEVINDN